MSNTPETDQAANSGMGDLMNAESWEQSWRSMAEHARKLERERNTLRNAVRDAVAGFDRLSWGYDGHCGAENIIRLLEDELDKQQQ